MIRLITGSKGSGKTKQIIDEANEKIVESKGDVLFITDITNYPSVYINPRIRLIHTVQNGLNTEEVFKGALIGMYSCNYDITDIFIDGANRIINKSIFAMKDFYDFLEELSKKTNINFTLTVSSDELPAFMEKYDVLRLNK